jgi:hypothetical protein
VPSVSSCTPPSAIQLQFNCTFTANGTLTSAMATVLNQVLATNVCLSVRAGTTSVFLKPYDVGPDSAPFVTLPGTFVIDGVTCKVQVQGTVSIDSSANCGWRLANTPDPFIEWSYYPATDSSGYTFLMEWYQSTATLDLQTGDAWCVLPSDSYLTTTDPGVMDGGFGDAYGDPLTCGPKIYTGNHSPGSRSLAGSCTGTPDGSPFRSPNATWTAASFSGDGKAGTSFAKSSLTIAGYTGYRPAITANLAGVVHITADNVHYDYWFRCYRNSTKVIEYGSDSTGDGGGDTGSIANTFSVSVGDVITLGDPGDYNVCTNLAIWWTAT